jgi:hypothetical protein
MLAKLVRYEIDDIAGLIYLNKFKIYKHTYKKDKVKKNNNLIMPTGFKTVKIKKK